MTIKEFFNKIIKAVKRNMLLLSVSGKFKKQKNAESETNSSQQDKDGKEKKQPNRLWKNNKLNLTAQQMEELDNLKDKYIEVFNKSVEKGEDPWKTPDELIGLTGSTATQVTNVITTYDGFVRDSKGKILDRNNYEKITPTWKKYVQSLRHRI